MRIQMETCINYCEPGWAYMSSDEQRWRNRLIRLAREHPEECIILKKPEENDGFIYAKFPQKWIWVRPPIQRNMTDEQKRALAQRLTQHRRKPGGET